MFHKSFLNHMTEAEINRKKKVFEKMITGKNIQKIIKKGDVYWIYFFDKSIFKCSGFLPDDYGLLEFQSDKSVVKKLF